MRRPQAKGTFVRGRRDYEALTMSQRTDFNLAFDAIAEMRREGLSLAAASSLVGTTPSVVRTYAGDLLVKEGGRYYATPSDRRYRRMNALSTEGPIEVDTRGSQVRSTISKHWTAMRRYGSTGDETRLAPFEGVRVGGVELATDPDQVMEYLRRGEADVDDIYV
jgi:hypothetical protein